MIMASSSNSYSHLLFSSRSPSISISSSKLPIRLSSMIIHSRRRQQQHPVAVLKEKSGSVLGFSGLVEKKGLGCSSRLLQKNSWFESIRRRCNKGWGSEGEGDFDLEAEILEFMDCSDNPNKFPTKKDLINAGRGDLVEAIEKSRYWLSKGRWDVNSRVEEDAEFLHSDGSECHSLEVVDLDIIASEDSSSTPSYSGRETEKEESVEEEGLEERNMLFGHGFNEKKSDMDDLSCKNDYGDYWNVDSSSMFSDSKPASTTLEQFELELASTLRHLESELASILRSLKSVSEIDTSSLKGSDSPLDEFLELSDAWEFQETEVMNAKNKLRSIRTKLEILEGKIALVAIESKKYLEMKQKRINDAQLALFNLRTAWIVWPNKGLVVLACGSFDEWVSQRILMEMNSSDFISLVPSHKGSSDAFLELSDTEATDFGEASDKKYTWETLGLYLKNIWGSLKKIWFNYLKMQSKTETAFETVAKNLGNAWQSLVESNRLEHEDRMKTIFPDFNLDQEQLLQSTVFMSEFEKNYFISVSSKSKSVVEAIRGPLKRLAVMLVTFPLFLVRMVLLTLFGIFLGILGDLLGQVFMMGQNIFFRWFSKDKTTKSLYPKPPKPKDKPPKPKPKPKGEEQIIDVEAVEVRGRE